MKDSFRLSDVHNEVREYAENGLKDLKNTGIASLDEKWKLKKGYPLFIAGNPGSGKTEFIYEILMNTSIMYGWKHIIYAGEGGNPEHVFNELLHKYLQKPLKYANEKERIQAELFVDNHFILINTEIEFTIKDFFELISKKEIEYDIKFDTTVFDPFNDIKDEIEKHGNREDKYLAYALKEARLMSKKHNRIDILINHVSDVAPKNDADTGTSYLPPALPTQWAGGRTWWRRAFTMILIYKPYTFRKDETGRNYEENEGLIIIQKVKPKGVGVKCTVSFFWDWKKNRYYSYDSTGQMLYSCEKLDSFKPKLEPNNQFIITNQNDEMPF